MAGLSIYVAIQECFGKLDIFVNVCKGGDQADRSSEGSGRLAVDHMQELLEGQTILILKTGGQGFPSKPKRDLACTGVTVTSRPQRDPFFIRQSLHIITIEQSTRGI